MSRTGAGSASRELEKICKLATSVFESRSEIVDNMSGRFSFYDVHFQT